MTPWSRLIPVLLLAVAAPVSSRAAEAAAPIHALLVIGGCCHDYAAQKDILKKGLEERANIQVDIAYADSKSTRPTLPILGNPDYARGYDVIIHDECAADINDPAVVEGVLKPHRNGVPGVNLHCAMHCYRIGKPADPVTIGTPHGFWFEYLGLQSSGHGPQEPIAITFVDKDHPTTKGLADWTTLKEELYNNIKIFDTAHTLAKGKQVLKQKDGSTKEVEYVVAWTSTYGKTRVFNTTIGHGNQTVSDPRYLDLVTRGVVWAVDRPEALKH